MEKLLLILQELGTQYLHFINFNHYKNFIYELCSVVSLKLVISSNFLTYLGLNLWIVRFEIINDQKSRQLNTDSDSATSDKINITSLIKIV